MSYTMLNNKRGKEYEKSTLADAALKFIRIKYMYLWWNWHTQWT